MFIGRYNKFKCDTCGKEVIVKTYPKGWKHFEGLVGITHMCKECIKVEDEK